MKTALLILGKETSEFSKGQFNTSLFETAKETLKGEYEILTTVIEEGYDPSEEIAKFKKADVVILQYPVFWFSFPSILKKYIDEVYAYGEFFGFTDGPYGSGGMMKGKKFMLSTTWNAPAEEFDNPDSLIDGATFNEALISMRATHKFCGFEELVHFGSHDVIHNPEFEKDQARYIEHLKDQLLSSATKAA